MIQLENITHSFENTVIFSNFSLKLDKGIHAIIGKSGSGKTTLLKIIAGLIKPISGVVNVDAPVSVSFQENRLFPWYSALKNVSIVSDKDRAMHILSLLGLSDSLNKKTSELSGGMKRRVSLARALAVDSMIVLLDEPFAGLDNETAIMSLNVIRQFCSHKTVLISTHDLKIAKLLDSITEI